jgi:hypothetical protein
LENAAPALLNEISVVATRAGARVVEQRQPQTTLEKLLIKLLLNIKKSCLFGHCLKLILQYKSPKIWASISIFRVRHPQAALCYDKTSKYRK